MAIPILPILSPALSLSLAQISRGPVALGEGGFGGNFVNPNSGPAASNH